MSMTFFELPPPGELGGGWSLRFLTAAQMLECRGEGEAKAGEERDKALWANATLLSKVLLKEGEPAFPDGEAVLASLTVGQMDSLTRRWWEQDDFSGRTVREEGPVREEWTNREGSENERFDMARFLALGGGSVPAEETLAGVSQMEERSGIPQVWPRIILPPRAAETAQRAHREPYLVEGMAIPYSGEALPAESPGLPSQRQAGTGEELVRGGQDPVKVLVTETVQADPGLTVEELDAAVERDARRYDGGFTLL